MSDLLSLVIGANSSWVYASLNKKEERGERIPGGRWYLVPSGEGRLSWTRL